MTLALTHIPAYTEYWDRESWSVGLESDWPRYTRETLLPLLRNCSRRKQQRRRTGWRGVDAVVSGHSHIYQRGLDPEHAPVTAAITEDPQNSKFGGENKRRAMLAIIGGGGGALEEQSVAGRVQDTGAYSVTTARHHAILLDIVATEERGLRWIWTAVGTGGDPFDSYTDAGG